jgi:hypothetical protein
MTNQELLDFLNPLLDRVIAISPEFTLHDINIRLEARASGRELTFSAWRDLERTTESSPDALLEAMQKQYSPEAAKQAKIAALQAEIAALEGKP